MSFSDVKLYINYVIQFILKFPILPFIQWTIRHFSFKTSDSRTCLIGKTAIVTGGNLGIGYATSVLLASRGCRVIIACRSDAQKEKDLIIQETGNPNILIKKLDLAKLKSVHAFVEDIKKTEPKIDILINNAGVGAVAEHCTEDGINAVMQINSLGHILLTYLLVDQFKVAKSAKVVFVSSVLALFNKLTIDNFNPTDYDMEADFISNLYYNSKVCNILAAQELGKRLSKYNISVNCADPGIVSTGIFKKTYSVKIRNLYSMKASLDFLQLCFATDAFMSAQCSFHLATSPDVGNGLHYFRCKEFLTPRVLDDAELCNKIWHKIELLLGMDFDKYSIANE